MSWADAEKRLNKAVMDRYGLAASYQPVSGGSPLTFNVDLQEDVEILEGAEFVLIKYAIAINPEDYASPAPGDVITITADGRFGKVGGSFRWCKPLRG